MYHFLLLKAQRHLLSDLILRLRNNITRMYFDRYQHSNYLIILVDLYKLKIECKVRRLLCVIGRIEPYYKTPLLCHKYDKLEKVRELFQISRRQNHIAQQVTLCFKEQSLRASTR